VRRRTVSGAAPGIDLDDDTTGAAVAAPPPVRERERMQTDFDFELPRGYVDDSGTVHRRGSMRLATARDELLPLIDLRVKENPAYLTVVLLGLVITRIGTVTAVRQRPRVPAGLLPADQRRGPHPGRGDLPGLRLVLRGGPRRQPPGGIVTYGADRIYEEAAYVAYHFHWSHDQILDLTHAERARWVSEIARINTRVNEG
jgi:hypothetical protein